MNEFEVNATHPGEPASTASVVAYPRIHLGLLDCSNATPRRYGGSGFAIDGLPTVVTGRFADRSRLLDSTLLEDRSRAAIVDAHRRYERRWGSPPIELSVLECPQPHVGLGTKSSLLLATLTLLRLMTERPVDRDEVVAESERGGTSGVGIRTFFDGGWVFDAGQTHSERSHAPSSADAPTEPSLSMMRFAFPDTWRLHLLLCPGEVRSADAEVDFFLQNTPQPRSEALESIASAYHGIAPAVVTENLELLAEALRWSRRHGMKAAEIRGQSPAVADVLRFADGSGLAATMSSMGPLVVIVSNNDEEGEVVEDMASRFGADFLGSYRGRNTGYHRGANE